MDIHLRMVNLANIKADDRVLLIGDVKNLYDKVKIGNITLVDENLNFPIAEGTPTYNMSISEFSRLYDSEFDVYIMGYHDEDISTIETTMKFLKKNGRFVSICRMSAFSRKDNKAKQFQTLVSDNPMTVENLPNNTFLNNGSVIKCCLVYGNVKTNSFYEASDT